MLPFHPYAEIFPLIDGEKFAELVADVKANDLRERIVVLDGTVLDGRNRYRAALAAGLLDEDDGPDRAKYFVRFVPDVDGDPLRYVISKNLHRRHLNDDQRRFIAAKLVSMDRGRPAENAADCGISRKEAARIMATDEAGVERARTVIAKAAPEILVVVEQGKLSISAAATAAMLDRKIQSRIAAEAMVGRVNAAKSVIKQEARATRERELGERQLAAPVGKFGVIVEDFEWDHATWSEQGRDRAAENHYPVSKDAHTAEEIVARTKDRFECAADDCVCFMWATLQHLAIAIDVLRLRGFEYRSSYAWGKDKIGLGYWSREKHEILLIGVKGKIDCPAQGAQRESLIISPRGEHSAKPDCFLEMIEQYYPTLPKIELNARRARAGWTAWGLDAPKLPPHDPVTGEVTEADEVAA